MPPESPRHGELSPCRCNLCIDTAINQGLSAVAAFWANNAANLEALPSDIPQVKDSRPPVKDTLSLQRYAEVSGLRNRIIRPS